MPSALVAYVRLLALLIVTTFFSLWFAQPLLNSFSGVGDPQVLLAFFNAATIFGISFLAFYASAGTGIPSFVIAILFGMAGQPLLAPVVGSGSTLAVIVGISATFILFAGGLETPFRHFRKSIGKILSLSFLGLIASAVLLALVVMWVSGLQTEPVLVSTAVLLGAILVSTDPAAIVPIMKQLRFRHSSTPTVIIAESAVTDAVGALLTVTFLGLILSGFQMTSVSAVYAELVRLETGIGLLEELIVGILVGVLGYGLLQLLMRSPQNGHGEAGADTVFFFFVPIVVFLLAGVLGGSGYLAVFVTGLLVSLKRSLRQTNQFFNESIDAFLKPAIFLLLGALIDPSVLIAYAPLGIVVALLFMFVIRPLTVLVSLGPFVGLFKQAFSLRDIWFISFVRETGAIPAVLLITVAGLGVPQADLIVAVGMWVILLTLLIQPALTPWVAQILKVAETIDQGDVLEEVSDKPFVLLGTRGYSFARRLPKVVDWAVKHGIYEVVVLLCLEGRYSKAREAEMEEALADAAAAINDQRKCDRRKCVDIRLVSNKGFLQDNIQTLARKEEDLTIIFIGKRVLDYRLEEIRQLPVPLYFLD